LITQYIKEKRSKASWTPGKDWVSYSGPLSDEKEIIAAVDVLLDEWLVFGESARSFEKQFSRKLGKKNGVLTSSGSSANLLMFSAAKSRNLLGFEPGTKILTPVVCFPTTINPIIQNGFEPVFVDVELPSLNLNLDLVEAALEKDPDIKGIAFAHVLGNPPDMDRLMRIVEKYDLIFFEDACDALGSTYKGRLLGSFGYMSSCSFYPAHHMTMGEGGYIATDDGAARRVLASLREWGRDCYCSTATPNNGVIASACGDRFKEWLPGAPGINYDHRYVYGEIGYNLKPTEMQAAYGLEQIKKLPSMHLARRHNFTALSEVFQPYSEFFHLPKATDGADPSWFAFLLTVKDDAGFTREQIVRFLEKNKIQTRSYFGGNILVHPGYHYLAQQREKPLNVEFPVAEQVTRNSFFVGTFGGITEEQITYIKTIVDKFFSIGLRVI